MTIFSSVGMKILQQPLNINFGLIFFSADWNSLLVHYHLYITSWSWCCYLESGCLFRPNQVSQPPDSIFPQYRGFPCFQTNIKQYCLFTGLDYHQSTVTERIFFPKVRLSPFPNSISEVFTHADSASVLFQTFRYGTAFLKALCVPKHGHAPSGLRKNLCRSPCFLFQNVSAQAHLW